MAQPPTPEAAGTPAPTGDAGPVVVRSEEQLQVGVQVRAAQRVRLRKHVVSEEATRTVTLRREELVVEHEPVTGHRPAQPHEADAHEEFEIVLHEERLEVRTVPVERVRVRVVSVAGEQTVTEVLRREQLDLDEDAGPAAPAS